MRERWTSSGNCYKVGDYYTTGIGSLYDTRLIHLVPIPMLISTLILIFLIPLPLLGQPGIALFNNPRTTNTRSKVPKYKV